MKRDSIDKRFKSIPEVKAPPYLTEKVMRQIEQTTMNEDIHRSAIVCIINIRRLGISMIAAAMLMFATVFLPIDAIDIFHHTVQAQTEVITQQTDRAYNFIYSPIQKANNFLNNIQKKINMIKE